MSIGYLYILINPTMPGLAKVGKTTRDPSTRVAELSAATGIASPFILAYQQPVLNCDVAESIVHAELGRKGFRVANNREFFNAPLHEIVALINALAGAVPEAVKDSSKSRSKSKNSAHSVDIVEELLGLGHKFNEGNGVLINKMKALKYYEQAANLQSDSACVMAALLHRYGGKGIKPNLEEAIRYYEMAVSLGRWACNEDLAEIFQNEKQASTASNFRKKYFEEAYERRHTDKFRIKSLMESQGAGYFYSVACSEYKNTVPNHLFSPFAQGIVAFLTEKMKTEPANFPWHLRGKFSAALKLFEACQAALPQQRESK